MGARIAPMAEAPPVPRLPWPVALAVALAAIAAQAWVCELPFQMDDYLVLEQPAEVFGMARSEDAVTARGMVPFMMRWTTWSVWTAYHAVVPKPLSSIWFHVPALLMHGLLAVLLATAALRLLPRAPPGARGPPWLAAAFAGCLFGLQSGGIQPVSWSCAWADIFYCLFGLAALLAFLRARESRAPREPQDPQAPQDKGRGRARLAAYAFVALALFSKEPGAMTVPALLLILGGRAWRAPDRKTALRSFALREALPMALALLAVLAARKAYLGHAEIRYYTISIPSPADAPAAIGRGVRALVQALYPWNQEPIFSDRAPLLGRLGLANAALGWTWVFALAGAIAGRRLGSFLAALGLAILLAAPAGLIYAGAPNNAVSRALYLPLLAATAALGIGTAGWLARRHTVPIGIATLGLACLVALDGRAHVADTERLAGAEISRSRALVDEAVREQRASGSPRELAILFVTGEPGYGGIPLLGGVATHAFRPAFTGYSDLTVLDFADERELFSALPDDELIGRDVLILGPGADPAELGRLEGEELRTRRAVRRWTPIRPGRDDPRPPQIEWLPAAGRFRPPAPISPHTLADLELAIEPGPEGAAEIRLIQGDHVQSIAFGLRAADAERRVVLLPTGRAQYWLGEPIEALEWRSNAALARPPLESTSVRALEPLLPADRARQALDPAQPLRFTLRAPPFGIDAGLPDEVVIELRVLLVAHEFLFRCRTTALEPLAQGAPDTRTVELAALELAADDTRAIVGADAVPWPQFARDVLAPGMRARGREVLTIEWRALLAHPGGALAARSPWRAFTLVREP